MQLPRGTFREIRKNVAIESLLHALNGEKFSGVANISSQSRTGTLVFKTGNCILVKVQNSCGDAGWDEIEKDGSIEVDAVLSLLDEAQINLALEFNKTCRILKPRKQASAQAPHQSATSPSREQTRSVQAQKPATLTAPMKSVVKPVPTQPHVPAHQTAVPQAPVHAQPPRPLPFSKAGAPLPPSPPAPALRHEDGKKNKTDEPPEKDRDTDSIESDLDSFDTMDFENVTDKIRNDCKTMIKQLHLDHLMER